MLNDSDRQELVLLKAELAQLSTARSNVSIALDGLASTGAAQLAIQATLLPILLKKVKQQGRWAAGDWAQSGPDIGPTMAKIEALLARSGVAAVATTTAPPAIDMTVVVNTVNALAKQVEHLTEIVAKEGKTSG